MLHAPTPRTTVTVGSAIAIGATLAGLLAYQPLECPEGYSQQQVDATGCYIGAMIGPSWLWPIAIGLFIELITLVVAAKLYAIKRRRNKV